MPEIGAAVIVLAGMMAIAIGVLAWIQHRYPEQSDPLVGTINELLPQTQCAQCGYPGCRPYAEALVRESAPIDLCPPGGEATVQRIAELLPDSSRAGATLEPPTPQVALIDEQRCIGCYLCIEACPVDAIVGAPKRMHTVLADRCTGCELCIPPCPVDCIKLVRT